MYQPYGTPMAGNYPPGMAPGMMAPGMMAPGMMAPGMMGPGMMAPGMMGPGMMAPGMMNMSVPLTGAPPQQGMTAQGALINSLPMDSGCCRTRFFQPMFSQGLPFSYQEYESIINEINSAMEAALPPKFVQILPILMIPCGFLLFVAGGFRAVATHSFSGPSPITFVMIGLGMLLLVVGGVSTMGLGCVQGRAVTACRQRLSELNMRFVSQKVDFQLHEQQHLQMHTTHGNHMHHGGMQMHVVSHYTLVIQVLDAAGRRSIPEPHVLASQALQPSAPTMEMQGSPA